MINTLVIRNGVATESGELVKLGCLTLGNPPCSACIAMIAGAEVPVANLIIAGLLCNGLCNTGVDPCCWTTCSLDMNKAPDVVIQGDRCN